MKHRIVFGCIIMLVVLTLPALAGGKDELQKYFNNTATQVKATDNPVEKRAILSTSLKNISSVLSTVQNSPLVSADDRAGINRFKIFLQEKQDELAGTNGFVRVSDQQLNDFSDYVVQDMEQAEVITISLVTLLLIIILVLLIAH